MKSIKEYSSSPEKHLYIIMKLDGCGHCVEAMKHWEPFSKKVSKHANVAVVSIEYKDLTNLLDADSSIEVGGVPSAFPVIRHVHNKKVTEMMVDNDKFPQTLKGFENFFKKTYTPAKKLSKSSKSKKSLKTKKSSTVNTSKKGEKGKKAKTSKKGKKDKKIKKTKKAKNMKQSNKMKNGGTGKDCGCGPSGLFKRLKKIAFD